MREVRGFLWIGLAVLAAISCLEVSAAEFQPIGSRAISMGGAGVASSRGPYAAYFNPALLARSEHHVHIALGGGVGYREVNLVQVASDLNDLDIEDAFDALADNARSGAAVDEALRRDLILIDRSIRSLVKDNGFQFMPTASLGIQVGNFGFGAFMLAEATAFGVIDENRLDLIVEQGGRYFEYNVNTGSYGETTRADYEARSLEYAMDNGRTYVQLTGVTYTEIPIAYAHRFETVYGGLALGASAKVMPGTAFDLRVDVDTDDFDEEWSNAQNNSTTFGVDAGVLWSGREERFALGLVVKNINKPTFKINGGDDLSIKPQVRAGVAYALTRWCELALDLDLTRNETFLPSINSQFLGGGISLHPRSWFSARAGVMANLAESDDGLIVTGGLGFGAKQFQLDLSAQVSTESSRYDDSTVPRYARAQLALVSKWK